MSLGLAKQLSVCVLLVAPRTALCTTRLACVSGQQRARAHCCALQPRHSAITAQGRPSRSARTGRAVVMSSSYKNELQAACEAVRLAARLCTVSPS